MPRLTSLRLEGLVERLPSAVLALGVSAPIVLIRVALQGALGANAPFILSWPATMLAAFIGGFWPSTVISVLGLLVGQWALHTAGAREMGPGAIVIYLAFNLIFAVAGGLRQRGLARAAADATRLEDMQRRLSTVARLNAMGELAATLAHELNQPLTAIAAYAGAARRIAERDADQPGPISDLVENVIEQTMRAREIVTRIRSYVTRGELDLEPHTLSEMFDEACAVVVAGSSLPAPVIRREFEPAADQVLVDRIQAQQVMVNLIRNASEAMADSPRRELRLGSRVGEDGLVEAFVADTGPGLAPEMAERLFEPFVSSKADGMGVGLSICRSIVEAHGGAIRAGPNPEGGARFSFTLQRAAA